MLTGQAIRDALIQFSSIPVQLANNAGVSSPALCNESISGKHAIYIRNGHKYEKGNGTKKYIMESE